MNQTDARNGTFFFRLVTLQLEEDPHQRGRQTGADGPAPRPPGRRTRAPEKAPAAHPGDAWGTTATTTGHRPLRDLYGMHAIQAIGLSGAAHAPGHHQHKTRRGDPSGATLATQISNAEQRAARTPPAATHAQGPRGHRQVPPPHPEPARPQGQNRTNGTSDYSGFWLWLPCDGKLHHRIGGRHRSCGQRCEPHHHRCVRRSRCNSSAPFSNCFSVCFGDVFGFLGRLTSNY